MPLDTTLQRDALEPTRRPTRSEPRCLRSPGRGFERSKRAIDLALGLGATAALLPVLVFCGAWIWAVDGRPIFYRQWRVGRDGWLFRIWKFRTMGRDAERGGARFAARGDARVLPGCGWMRRSHADELPQLWNIVRGEMSLVGPRPERPEMIRELRADVPGIERRLRGVPGLTGLAQVRNGYTNDVPGARRKLAYDLRYLRRRRVATDLKLMLQTVPKLWDTASC